MLQKNSISISAIMTFMNIFSSKIIEKAAVYTFFVQRTSKLTGSTFFKAFTIGLWEKPNATLEEIASIMKEFTPLLSISKQGLSDRIKKGVNFLKVMLWQTMEMVLSSTLRAENIDIIKDFKKVYIADTTIISLPESLSDTWPGVGGIASKAALKIQALYDMVSQSFHYLDIDKGTGSDGSLMDKIVQIIHSGELLIADKESYYLSRIKSREP